jgi:hypothetical protein
MVSIVSLMGLHRLSPTWAGLPHFVTVTWHGNFSPMCRRCTVELLCILGNRECAQHVRGCCKSLQHFVRMCTVLGIGETQEGNVYVHARIRTYLHSGRVRRCTLFLALKGSKPWGDTERPQRNRRSGGLTISSSGLKFFVGCMLPLIDKWTKAWVHLH